ncbi:hypothetical protein OI450_06725 [Pectobacterium cacticida]|uniref:Uncharacterized protein n=1 Tax=Pectobacterium cacticida TaxID=69221 RepID=A0ABZ2G711_9GAMM|nr:hypothetical protein [Pectobacterium cacticida]UYX08051.1 hypothetical protein OI450_06725 [Pectobacterium cacticida]
MNDQEMEKELLGNGFTQNDIAKMRKIISRSGDGEETLMTLINSLKKTFYNECIISFTLISAFFINVIFNISGDIVEILIHLLFTGFFISLACYFGPVDLAYKSYSYLKRKNHE